MLPPAPASTVRSLGRSTRSLAEFLAVVGALVASCAAPTSAARPVEPRPLALTLVERRELEPPPEAFRVRKRPIGCWLDAHGRAWVALLGTGVYVFGPDGGRELSFERRAGSLGLYAPIQTFHESVDGRVFGATHDTLEEFVPATGAWFTRPRAGPLRVPAADGSAALELSDHALAWSAPAAASARPIPLRPRGPERVFQRAAVHGSSAVVCEIESGSDVAPPRNPQPTLHFLREGVLLRSLQLPTDAWPAGLAFDGERAALITMVAGDPRETRFELWLVRGDGELARAELDEPDGLHEPCFTAGGRELVVFVERRPALVRYRFEQR